MDFGERGTAALVPADEGGGEPLEARPPLGVKLGIGLGGGRERVGAALEEVLQRAFRQCLWIIDRKAPQHVVQERAALRRARHRRDRIERVKTQDVLGVDRVRVAHHGLDLGDAERAREGEQHRIGLRGADGAAAGRRPAGRAPRRGRDNGRRGLSRPPKP